MSSYFMDSSGLDVDQDALQIITLAHLHIYLGHAVTCLATRSSTQAFGREVKIIRRKTPFTGRESNHSHI